MGFNARMTADGPIYILGVAGYVTEAPRGILDAQEAGYIPHFPRHGRGGLWCAGEGGLRRGGGGLGWFSACAKSGVPRSASLARCAKQG